MANKGAFVSLVYLPWDVLGEPTSSVVEDATWMTVNASGLVGYADSDDLDQAPDYTPVKGTVVFVPSTMRPLRKVSTGDFVLLGTATATFDSNGVLRTDAGLGIRLIPPLWDDLSDTTWTWRAQVRPAAGQGWTGFEVTFTGQPGDDINLSSYL